MQRNTKGASTQNKVSGGKKQNEFDSIFEKYAKQLPKDYVEQFKKPEYKLQTKDQKVKDAMRSGKRVEVVNRGVKNAAHGAINIGKALEDDIEIKEVPKEIATQVSQARATHKLTQDQLAKKICEKSTAIKDLEACEGAYDPKVVEKIEKALGVKFDRPWKK